MLLLTAYAKIVDYIMAYGGGSIQVFWFDKDEYLEPIFDAVRLGVVHGPVVAELHQQGPDEQRQQQLA